MHLPLDPKSGTPLYVQIKDQMRLAVATGALQPGDQLPTVRDLATQLRVNPNTVARVYRELQAEGLLASRQGSGTFVSPEALGMSVRAGRDMLRREFRQTIATGVSLGLDAGALLALFQETLGQPMPDPPETHTPEPFPETGERHPQEDGDLG